MIADQPQWTYDAGTNIWMLRVGFFEYVIQVGQICEVTLLTYGMGDIPRRVDCISTHPTVGDAKKAVESLITKH